MVIVVGGDVESGEHCKGLQEHWSDENSSNGAEERFFNPALKWQLTAQSATDFKFDNLWDDCLMETV